MKLHDLHYSWSHRSLLLIMRVLKEGGELELKLQEAISHLTKTRTAQSSTKSLPRPCPSSSLWLQAYTASPKQARRGTGAAAKGRAPESRLSASDCDPTLERPTCRHGHFWRQRP